MSWSNWYLLPIIIGTICIIASGVLAGRKFRKNLKNRNQRPPSIRSNAGESTRLEQSGPTLNVVPGRSPLNPRRSPQSRGGGDGDGRGISPVNINRKTNSRRDAVERRQQIRADKLKTLEGVQLDAENMLTSKTRKLMMAIRKKNLYAKNANIEERVKVANTREVTALTAEVSDLTEQLTKARSNLDRHNKKNKN